MLKILVIEDEAIVRRGILQMLADPKIKVEAVENGEAGLRLARDIEPDIIFLDIKLPGLTALEISKKILHANPKQKIIILTACRDVDMAKRLIEKGVVGYLIKGCDQNEMLKAVKMVAEGNTYICHEILSQIAVNRAVGDHSPFNQLSDKEIEIVLMMIQHYMDAKAISKALFLETKTINSYRRAIFKKLGVQNEVGVLRLAIQYRFFDFGGLDNEIDD